MARETGILWLFIKVDLDLVKPDNQAWKPSSRDQVGAWQ